MLIRCLCLSAITGLVEDAGDRIFVMNPSRADPKHVVAHSFGGSKSKVIAIPGNSGPKRAILTTLGIVRGSNVLYPVPFSNSSSKLIKQLAMIPIKGEWERAGNFLGTAFRLANTRGNGGYSGPEQPCEMTVTGLLSRSCLQGWFRSRTWLT